MKGVVVGDQTKIDLDGVRREATSMQGVSDRLNSAFNDLKATLTARDGCWGDDEFGRAFAKGYVDPAKQCLENIEATTKNVHQVAENLREVPRYFEEADKHNAAAVRKAATPENQTGRSRESEPLYRARENGSGDDRA
jgi:uncharacterized protein YukE